MNSTQVTQAAEILWRNWQGQSRIDALPVHCRPADRAQGYAIAAALAQFSGQAVAGWKIAATSEAGQKHINVDGPLAGRILSSKLLQPGSRVPLGDNVMRVAEAEFAFRLARDLPPRPQKYVLNEVMESVGSLHLSMEIPDSRYKDFVKVGAPQLIADTACACWLVVGDAVPADWREVDLAERRVDAYVDGQHRARGAGKAALGDPRMALIWLVNEVAQFAVGVKAGDIVTTGTCIVPVAIAPGSNVKLDYGSLGTLEAEIS